uniref:Uncharacterized protein n=1 Tax=Globisporangium ultimum (strain ATCC 200006 / CBS 805.95 / DAOM BR144) TaxID=431595 RepID=K3WG53_GLOUD
MGLCASREIRKADQQFEKTSTFVHHAMVGDLSGMKHMLAKEKMDPNAQDRFGMTALHWACYTGKLVCAQELLQAGASTKIVDQNGRNALHHACRKDQDDVVRFLLQDVKMDINSTSENKETPLHKAVRGKSIKSIELLLQSGANTFLRNDQNRTPLEELDARPVTLTDVVPGQISTARVNEELEEWRQKSQTEIQSKPKARTSLSQNIVMGKASKRRSTGPIENTLITKFGASIRELSGHWSSDYSFSSARSDMWTRVAATDAGDNSMSSSAANPPSVVNSTRGNDTSPSPVAPLDLAAASASLNAPSARTSSMSSISSTTVSEQDGGQFGIARQKNLRYAGKRVIMALRVKQKMPVDEKQEMIRLLLLKYMQLNSTACCDDGIPSSVLDQDHGCTKPPDSVEEDSVPKPRPQLHHCISGLTLSLPPDI